MLNLKTLLQNCKRSALRATKAILGLVALLNLSSWCHVMVEQLFLAVPWGCLRFVIVVFPDHTHLLFLSIFDIDLVIFLISFASC